MTYQDFAALAYLFSAVLFILSLKGLSSPATARRGNMYGIVGMALAIAVTLANPAVKNYWVIIAGVAIGGAVGVIVALRIAMTAMPQLVAMLHSLVGLAAVFVAKSAFYAPQNYGIVNAAGKIYTGNLVEMFLGDAIGAITFSGSLIAFGKLQGLIGSAPVRFKGQHALNALLGAAIVGMGAYFIVQHGAATFWIVTAISLMLGVTLIIPIGGADMPVIVSMLNSYSGWAAAGIGFTLNNNLLIITGALVGSSGAILSYIMCKAMNRSFWNVLFGGFGTGDSAAPSAAAQAQQRGANVGSVDDAAFLMTQAKDVIFVPGYGMAVSQAQHAVREMAELLHKQGVRVRYAIHPVAGRMPGHMNVLLADANVPYDQVFEMDTINNDFSNCDVAFVIGANDVTNPAAKNPQSPIYGMPILEVERSRSVIFCKRSLGSGYAGVDNELFYKSNTMMLLGDAKNTAESLVRAFKGGH
ncbi:MAG: NAD(P)(+) transhydrogenase (Re/Si-specific) subunit beta [Myxococcales bacterium]|nr:MAG: NAD(P)(+) transhydrogenase (Re/Si-specific) subunit beta [Myxococcales bacterium]